MLFENREQMKEFAKVLAKKMLERRSLSEWRKIAERATRVFSGKSYYLGMMRASPLPLGTYTKALNKMHFAVNGIRPYAEKGGPGSNLLGAPPPCGNPHAQICGSAGRYEICKCEKEGYTCAKACIAPDSFACTGVYKCHSEVECTTSGFACDVFWQNDQGCPTQDNYVCGQEQDGKTHACNEKQNPFSCKKGNQDGYDDYDCINTYMCSESYTTCKNSANFTCDGPKFICQLDHQCGMRLNEFYCARPGPEGFQCETACPEPPYGNEGTGFDCIPGYSE